MIQYLCDSILLENGQSLGNQTIPISVPSMDMTTPEDRYEHRVVITGVLEDIVGPVESFSYQRVNDAT